MRTDGTMLALAMAALLLGLASPPAAAASQEDPATAALSPPVRALVIREMQAIAEAMGRLHRALVTGDHGVVADQARAIHDSFVMNQEITEDQRREIGTRLPAGFLALDRNFHALAERLAQAGEAKDPALERLWFDEMTRTCLGCHESFAAGRFPGLAPDDRHDVLLKRPQPAAPDASTTQADRTGARPPPATQWTPASQLISNRRP